MDAVAISPIRLVTPASAVSRIVGSSAPAGRCLALPHSAGPSARKTESKVPAAGALSAALACPNAPAPQAHLVVDLSEHTLSLFDPPVAELSG